MVLPTAMEAAVQSSGFKWMWLWMWRPQPLWVQGPHPGVPCPWGQTPTHGVPILVCGCSGVHAHLHTGC